LRLLGEQGAPLYLRFRAAYQRLLQLRPGQLRRLQRKLGVGLAGAALLLALSGSPGLSAPNGAMTVTNGTSTVANSDGCSLPEAIINANANDQSGSTDCAAGSGADTITLVTDVTLTAVHNSTYGATGLPVVSSEITIEGAGHTISRDGAAPNFRIFAANSVANLTLSSVAVSGGSFPDGRGGGIYAKSASVTVTNSTISGNFYFIKHKQLRFAGCARV